MVEKIFGLFGRKKNKLFDGEISVYIHIYTITIFFVGGVLFFIRRQIININDLMTVIIKN